MQSVYHIPTSLRLIALSLILLAFQPTDLLAQNGHKGGHNHDHHDHSGHNHGSHDHSTHDHGSHKGHNHGSHAGHNHGTPAAHGAAGDHAKGGEGGAHKEGFDLGEFAIHHVADANEFHLFGDYSIPLPCITYHKEKGFDIFLSSKLGDHHHPKAYNGYVMDHGQLKSIKGSFPSSAVDIKADHGAVSYKGKTFELEEHSRLFSMGNFFDFSITKNVFSLLLAAILLCVIFFSVAKAYKNRKGQAPSGLQGFMEPLFTFIQDEVAKPMIPHQWEKYLPFLMTIFFLIFTCNLLGLIPFFPGSANLSGNIAFTSVLAVITSLVVNLSGNKHYWTHMFWMPGVPVVLKPIMAVIEGLGLLLKPFVLMLRLFANITGGHIVVICLVGLIFVFGDLGKNMFGAAGGIGLAVPFALFIGLIELLVAFLQAFIFTILAALYIGGAVEEAH